VDLTMTRFCDSAGLHVLVRAHRRALAEGGELRLAIPAEGAVARIFTVTGLDRLIPSFGSLDQALAPGSL
jgi:anti-anti-sigma factor